MTDIPSSPPEKPDFVNTRPGIDDVMHEGQIVARHMIQSINDVPEGQPVFSPMDDARLMTQGEHAHQLQQTYEKHLEARQDELTGLLSRRGFNELAESWFEGAESGEIGLLFIDIDNFKQLNDKVNHKFGDNFLIAFADWVQTELRHDNGRGGDRIAIVTEDPLDENMVGADSEVSRDGGDEVVIALRWHKDDNDLEPNDRLNHVAARLRKNFIEIFLAKHPAYRRFSVGMSIGGAIWEEGMTLQDLKEMADSEMYDEKNGKRGSKEGS